MQLAATLRYLGFVPGTDCVVRNDGAGPFIAQWLSAQPQPTPAQIAAAELPAAKAARIERDRQECRRRLFDFYGDAAEQLSRAMGIGYTPTATANHAAGVAATVAASNVARDAINAIQPGTTALAQVEAVTVTWPVLT